MSWKGATQGQEVSRLRPAHLRASHLRRLCQGERVFYLHSQIPHGRVNISVAQEDLPPAEFSRLLVVEGWHSAPARVSSVVLSSKADGSHPLVNEPSILSRADVVGTVCSARKDEVVQRTAAALQPFQQARPRGFEQFELNGPAGLLLDDYGSLPDATAAYQIADPYLHQVTATQLAVDCKIEQRAISKPSLLRSQ